MDFVASAMGSF